VTLERLVPAHISPLFKSLGFPENNKMLDLNNGFPYIYNEGDLSTHLFSYLRKNPDLTIFAIKACESKLGPSVLTQVQPHTHVMGIMGYRTHSPSRTIKLDDFLFSPLLQRTYAATEAHYLLLRHLFEEQTIQYCRVAATRNALNIQAQHYHARMGYIYEGTFRKDNVTRWGTPRDSACSSMLDDEWPSNKSILLRYLLPSNFDSDGKQIKSLKELRMLLVKSAH
jgi:RimJ/RimL family protein N-acetyltransferase